MPLALGELGKVGSEHGSPDQFRFRYVNIGVGFNTRKMVPACQLHGGRTPRREYGNRPAALTLKPHTSFSPLYASDIPQGAQDECLRVSVCAGPLREHQYIHQDSTNVNILPYLLYLYVYLFEKPFESKF